MKMETMTRKWGKFFVSQESNISQSNGSGLKKYSTYWNDVEKSIKSSWYPPFRRLGGGAVGGGVTQQEYLLDHGFSLQDKHPSHMHSYLGAGFHSALNACFWTVGRNWKTREKPTRAWWEHANSNQKGTILNETQKVLTTAPPCCP